MTIASCSACVALHPPRAGASRGTRLVLAILVLGLGLAAAPGGSAEAGISPPKLGPDHRVQLLSGPSTAAPRDIASGYLSSHLDDLGLTAADVSTLQLAHEYSTDGLGTNLFYEQRVDGIPVFNGITSVHVLPSGAILTVNNTAVSDVGSRLSARVPVVSAAQAYTIALQNLGRSVAAPVVLQALDPARQGVAFTGEGATERPVPVQLMYVERPEGVRLAWELYVMTTANEVWYMHVDAVDGAVLQKHNLVYSLDKFRVYPFNAESPISTEVPTNLGHQIAEELGDLQASPLGWVSGATTSGNNVVAVEDRDNTNNALDTRFTGDGYQPTGTPVGTDLVFDFAHNDLRNPCEQPSPLANVRSNAANLEPCDAYNALDHNTNLDAAIVNLFYWNNVIHDVMYHYGFTEAAGNFQKTNFTVEGTGRGGDPVSAQAQDGSGTNNANFFTPPDDGVTSQLLPPTMQMFEWSPPAVVRVNLPAGFQDYDEGDNVLSAATASFGAKLKNLDEAARTGDIELGNDGSTGDGTGTVNDGCEPLVGFTPGKIALLDRGLCEFGVKVLNAERAGAKAAIIANTLGREVGNAMGPGVVGGQVTIPSVMIGETNGKRIKTALGAGTVNVTLEIVPVPNRDSDFDAGVIAHEYGHGISNRFIGGPSSIACLINAQQPDPASPGALIPIGEQMGEGWSDLYALILTAQSTDTGNTPRGVGAYISFQTENGPGIRRFPYTRNMSVNPLTYGNVPTEAVPHGVGTVWASMVWDLYWTLVDDYGFEPNLLNSTSDAGNVKALHLINNGLVVTKCRPSFVDARDALLAAEAADGDTADHCSIWNAFARRGLGVAALNPTGGEDHRRVVEDFTVPPHCATDNLAPEAADDAYSTKRHTLLSVPAPGVLKNDADPDRTPITARLINAPRNAKSFTLNPDGSFSYEPKSGFTGVDRFTYVAQDGQVSSNQATVTIEVAKRN